jgi:hydrogenase maturation protease
MEGTGEPGRSPPRSVTVDGVEIGRGSRVVLRPRAGGDIFDQALAGRLALIHGIDQDLEGKVHLAVTLEDDPGRDLGEARQPGHRFFFSPSEVEPLADEARPRPAKRLLVAGVGNIFMGDDAFGVEVSRRLAAEELPPGVEVEDFGIRGVDLAYALGEDYDAVVLVDAVPRGEPPGTLFVIEPRPDEGEGTVLDAHGMDPVRVLGLARQLGSVPERVLIVGCEPELVMSGDEHELVGELSAPVRGALDEAVQLVKSVVEELLSSEEGSGNEEGSRGVGHVGGDRRSGGDPGPGASPVHEDQVDVRR